MLSRHSFISSPVVRGSCAPASALGDSRAGLPIAILAYLSRSRLASIQVGFGENQLFTVHTCGLKVQHWIYKNLGMGFPLITGRWGCTFLPHRTKVVHVYGKPIRINEACANPTETQVLQLTWRFLGLSCCVHMRTVFIHLALEHHARR